ncbi:MAG: hypothetical protein R6V34_03990 [Bacteroidales bacterium]
MADKIIIEYIPDKLWPDVMHTNLFNSRDSMEVPVYIIQGIYDYQKSCLFHSFNINSGKGHKLMILHPATILLSPYRNRENPHPVSDLSVPSI